MASQLQILAGTVVDDASTGDVAWSNPDNAKVSDNVYAVAVLGIVAPFTSHWLKATDFGFSIPNDAIITGIVVGCEAKVNVAGWILDYVRIVKGGIIKTSNKTLATYTPTESYKSTGSSSDLWGETWTPAEINASDFGVAISTYGGVIEYTISIDHIQMTVYYTENRLTATGRITSPSRLTAIGRLVASNRLTT